jgi:hypothetical protein
VHLPTHVPRSALLLAAAAALALTTACRNAGPAFGTTPDAARANAKGMLTALEQRFTGVERAPKFAHGRAKMFAHALVPSRVYDDTSVWNDVDASGLHSLTVV